ncbi:Lipoteichoic acid synthase 1 [Polaribacter huanghezhanensis]|uniref:sulfatase-like hydrolase/transferase n=1 Tax=Polaribacter huanghezhanensis TaxID=1354726 RepID=UPI0026473703|nr:sulfatase-like hydrolase/transferase [Polaribacter huanghezhanensis]WKD86194.1 Lipoteichoic acid synthase 1 [Polaribacter huanghezhanensis]
MKKILINKNTVRFLRLSFALIVSFYLISLFEIISNLKDGETTVDLLKLFGYPFFNDFIIGSLLSILFFPIFLVLNIGKKKYGVLGFKIIGVLLVLSQYSLVKYSLTTKLNLGADLLGYSFNDMYITVSSSEEFSLFYFVPFILFPVLFLAINTGLIKIKAYVFLNKLTLLLLLLSIVIKIFVPEISQATYQNKIYFLGADIIQFEIGKQQNKSFNEIDADAYPFLKSFSKTNDVLSPFFTTSKKRPNIVIIMVEGLGGEFVGGNSYSGFTPFIDSLIPKSLYWENFVSNAGRTFGVLPSLTASLPFGDTGFLALSKTPAHLSLFSILGENGYTTSFYTGDQASFDNRINFLEYNNVGFITDENQFGTDYVKTAGNSGGFSWGYPDAEIYRKMLSTLADKKQPRLDVIMTLSNHEPFNFPDKNLYIKKVDSLLNSTQKFDIPKADITANKNIYATLLYTDHSLKKFMQVYAKRADYNNTIFVITGDHRLIPIEQKDKLCRFHVPLLIYSPLLKRTARFKSVSSHWDVTPSLVSFLSRQFNFKPITQTAWMGTGLDTVKDFRNIHQIALMRYKGGLKDFIYKDYMLSSGDLYKIKSNFGIYQIKNDSLLNVVSGAFQKFKQLNAYVTSQNKIYPQVSNESKIISKVKFSTEELKLIKNLTKGLNSDQIFLVAKNKAFNSDRKTARLLCNYLLNSFPNHVDAMVLKGRTLAWDGNYKEAEVEFLEAINKFPFYDDPYSALLDLYWWSDQDYKGITIAKKALINKVRNPDISFKLAKAYQRLEDRKKAIKVVDSLLKIYPKKQEYLTLKKTLQ